MRPESRKLLFDLAQACRAVREFNARGTLADYSADAMRRAATERMFEIMGEALGRLRNVDGDTFGKISGGAAIIGFCHRLMHGYDAVDDEIVWKVVQEKVPVLAREVRGLLGEDVSGSG